MDISRNDDIQAKLEKLRAYKKKPKYGGYFAVIFIVLILINVMDEVTTAMGSGIQSNIVNEFYVQGQGLTYNQGLSQFASVTAIVTLVGFLGPFYKALADRFGRKPFVILNVLIMAIGMFLSYLSPSLLIFYLGYTVIQFIIIHDMQIVYILEVAPKQIRARFYSAIKSLGVVGLLLVPILRDLTMGNDGTLWRNVFFIPAIFGAVVVIIALFLLRESDVYVANEIERLEHSLESPQAAVPEHKKTGIIHAIRYIIKQTDLRWLVIAIVVYYAAVPAMAFYYQSIMYASGMSDAQVTQALFVYPIVYGVLTLGSGFIADFLGRKNLILACVALTIVSFALFIFGTGQGWTPYIIGGLYGLYLGAYWIGGDYLMMMGSESLPTSIRTSGMGSYTLFIKLTSTFSNFAFASLVLSFDIKIVCLVIAVPCTLVAALIVFFKLHETKGIDMGSAGSQE